MRLPLACLTGHLAKRCLGSRGSARRHIIHQGELQVIRRPRPDRSAEKPPLEAGASVSAPETVVLRGARRRAVPIPPRTSTRWAWTLMASRLPGLTEKIAVALRSVSERDVERSSGSPQKRTGAHHALVSPGVQAGPICGSSADPAGPAMCKTESAKKCKTPRGCQPLAGR